MEQDRHIRLWKQLFPDTPTKSQRRQLDIAEAAIGLYANQGVDKTTYENVAKRCGVSRPLVIRYFPTYGDLFDFCVRFVRAQFQELVVAEVAREKTAERRLAAYIRSTFVWTEDYPDHARFWLLFFYQCGLESKYAKLNAELVQMGTERIALIMADGGKVSPALRVTARRIQLFLTSCLVAVLTESHSSPRDMSEMALAAAKIFAKR